MADIRANSMRIRGTSALPQAVVISETFDEIESRFISLGKLVAKLGSNGNGASSGGSTPPATGPGADGDVIGVINTSNSVVIDIDAGLSYTITLNVPLTTILNPSSGSGATIPDGTNLLITLIEDSTGGRGVQFGNKYTGVTNLGLDPGAGAVTIYSFRSRTDGTWWVKTFLALSNL